MDDFLVERVLVAVEQIPPGRVVAYGDIARLVGTSPRRVGAIMRGFGADVTWWRVVGAAGDPGGNLIGRARPHWDAEGIVIKPNGLGCRMSDYRADLDVLADAYRTALSALLARSGTPLPAIGAPATSALATIGVTALEQVIEYSEAELLPLHGMGPKAIRLLADELARLGWAWTARDPGTSPG